MTATEFTIIEPNLANAQKMVARLERLAAKMERKFCAEFSECDPVGIEFFNNDPWRAIGTPKSETIYFPAQTLAVEFDGENDLLTHGNSRFVASIELLDSGDSVVLTAPGYDKAIPAHYYTTQKNHCDHCGHNRQRRRFFLVEKDGELLQVGSTCVKEFVGVDPARLLAVFQTLKAFTGQDILGDDLGGSCASRGFYGRSVESIVAMAAIIIKHDGGYTKGETWRVVHAAMFPPVYDDSESVRIRAKYQNTECAIDFDAFKTFVSEMAPNNYTNNLKSVVNSTQIDQRNLFAILVSGVYVYMKEIELLGPKPSRLEIVNEWVDAQPKQRVKFNNVRVIGRKYIDTDFGESTLYKMLDEAGRPLTWFSSNDVPALDDAFENATTVALFTATVKKLDQYNGNKQTMVNRGKVG